MRWRSPPCGYPIAGRPWLTKLIRQSDLSQNPLDYTDRYAINRGGLGRRHAVLDPDADARKLRARDLARHRLLRADRRFSLCAADRRRRQSAQNTRLPRRWFGRHYGSRNRLLGDLLLRCKECLGRSTRARHWLAIIAASMVLVLLAVEQVVSPRDFFGYSLNRSTNG